MGLFSGIAKSLTSSAGSIFGNIAGGVVSNIFANRRQNDAQDFSAEQQQEAQEFNSAEALANREWQERMSNTANQRAVSDLRSAGLNPMLALQQHGATTPGGGQGSVAASSAGIANPAHEFDIAGAMHSASQIRLNQATTDREEAAASKTRAEEDEIRARTPTHAVSIDQMRQNIEESKNRINKIIQETSTSAHSAANLAQQTINLQEVIPQIRATVENLRAQTKLHGAQTTLAGAQTGLAKAGEVLAGAHTGQAIETTAHTRQIINANLPALENALKNLERVAQEMSMPGRAQDEAVADSFIGSLSATMKALNPFTAIMPTLPVRGTGAPAPQPGRKDWKK